MTWNFDPTAFSFLGLEVRWYGLSYLFGFLVTLHWGHYLLGQTKLKMRKDDYENLIFGLFFSGIIGGRMGEFLFYSPSTFWTNPLEILQVWNGGMSIHGGIIAACLYGFWWARKHQVSFWKLADILVIHLAIGLGGGRLANFINGELVGIPTDQSWGVVFPHVDDLFRHPSQLYEMGKNFVMATILFFLFKEQITLILYFM